MMSIKVRNFAGFLSNIFTLLSTVICVCFDPEKELKKCSDEYKFVLPNRDIGYAFGFGSINDTETMCKTQWHIKLLDCMSTKAKLLCKNNPQDNIFLTIWEFTLDNTKFKSGADYLCKPQNLQVFYTHKDRCLVQQETAANQCAKLKSATIEEAIKALANESQNLHSGHYQYSNYVKKILNNYECKGLKRQLKCLYNILHINCHPNAVHLILGYFREILPSNCEYVYEPMLTNYINSDYYKNRQNAIIDTGTPSVVSLKNRQINNDNQEPENGFQKQSCIVYRVSVYLQVFLTIFQRFLFFEIF